MWQSSRVFYFYLQVPAGKFALYQQILHWKLPSWISISLINETAEFRWSVCNQIKIAALLKASTAINLLKAGTESVHKPKAEPQSGARVYIPGNDAKINLDDVKQGAQMKEHEEYL